MSTYTADQARADKAETGPHRVVSIDGWECDICGAPVNGQTDESGTPVIDGDSVRHLN